MSKELQLPYEFNERISLRPLPAWLLSEQPEEAWDPLRNRLRKTLADGARYCISVDYEADALGSPDPEWTGDSPRSIQEAATEGVRNIFLSFWVVHPTSLTFSEVAHLANHGRDGVVRQIANYDSLCPLPCYADRPFDTEDYARVRLLSNTLGKLLPSGNLRTAAQSTRRALTERAWALRFLMMWLVLESLFGPEDPREITFRLSQRIALFLGENRAEARELCSKIKGSYAWRSKIVHGLRLAKLTEEQSQLLTAELEELVRRSLDAILSDESLTSAFDGQRREEFLDGLVFA